MPLTFVWFLTSLMRNTYPILSRVNNDYFDLIFNNALSTYFPPSFQGRPHCSATTCVSNIPLYTLSPLYALSPGVSPEHRLEKIVPAIDNLLDNFPHPSSLFSSNSIQAILPALHIHGISSFQISVTVGFIPISPRSIIYHGLPF